MAPIYHLCSNITNAFRSKLRQTAVPDNKTFRDIVDILYKEGFIASYATGDERGPFLHGTYVPATPSNIGRRRLWLDLKYREGLPALSEMNIVSKPSRRVYASVEELKAVAAARNASTLLKAQKVGQITIINSPYGIVELKDALAKNVGGEVLCYAR
ncbi:hypothetical protein HK102_001554 [Quaeritorhiza haematococci]|nr:hypothetical protein HK102_001554 [Quaeritorhiza haematococci]